MPTTSLGYVHWKQGRREEALELFRRSAARDHEHMRPELDVYDLYVLRYDLAVIDAIQGRESEAYEWLERASTGAFASIASRGSIHGWRTCTGSHALNG